MKRRVVIALLAGSALVAGPHAVPGQVARPPSGGVLNRYLAPPGGLEQEFLGAWNLTWDDPADPDCPCHGTLAIEVEPDGSLRGLWSMKGPAAVLRGNVAFDQNVWAGRYAQPDDVDFPLKGHFRLEARGGTALSGSYQRDGTAIPFHWSATRR